jgi:hypothetical protein
MSLRRAEALGGVTAALLVLPRSSVYPGVPETAPHIVPVDAPNPIQPEGLRVFSQGQRYAWESQRESASSPD